MRTQQWSCVWKVKDGPRYYLSGTCTLFIWQFRKLSIDLGSVPFFLIAVEPWTSFIYSKLLGDPDSVFLITDCNAHPAFREGLENIHSHRFDQNYFLAGLRGRKLRKELWEIPVDLISPAALSVPKIQNNGQWVTNTLTHYFMLVPWHGEDSSHIRHLYFKIICNCTDIKEVAFSLQDVTSDVWALTNCLE